MNLEDRVKRLERSSRWSKLFALASLAFALGLVAHQFVRSEIVLESDEGRAVLRSTDLRFFGPDSGVTGRPRVDLSGYGVPALHLMDDAGQIISLMVYELVSITVNGESPSISVRSGKEYLGLSPSGVRVYGADGSLWGAPEGGYLIEGNAPATN